MILRPTAHSLSRALLSLAVMALSLVLRSQALQLPFLHPRSHSLCPLRAALSSSPNPSSPSATTLPPPSASLPCSTLIICGPSGAGKGTIIARLLERYPNALSLSVSHTTRAPRPGEIEGTHYHFVPLDRLRASIEKQSQPGATRKFLEHAQVHGNYYATSLNAVQRIWDVGKVAILDVDTKGVEQIRQARELTAKYVFLLPPDMPTLLQRLQGRGTDSAEQIAIRMANADKQIDFMRQSPELWDQVLENGRLDECVARLARLMHEWFPQHIRQV